MELIDTHCHLDVSDFDHDREQVLERCHGLGIRRIVIPGIHRSGWSHLMAVCRQYDGLYPAYGLHPVFIGQHQDSDLAALETLLDETPSLALGEIGLDYYLTELDRERQQYFFDAQLTMAQQKQLPVILHVRKSHDQVLASLRRINVQGGICHAFNGSVQQAQQYIDMGFKLGFGGMLTYERSSKLRKLAQVLPLESMVLETDAPDMTVAAHHGERNSPEYLPDCLQALSELRDMPAEEVAAQTTRNACEVFAFEAAE